MYTCVVSSVTGESSWSGVLNVRGTQTKTLHLLLFLSHFTLCHSHTSVVMKPHSLPLFFRTAPSVALMRMKVQPASCALQKKGLLQDLEFLSTSSFQDLRRSPWWLMWPRTLSLSPGSPIHMKGELRSHPTLLRPSGTSYTQMFRHHWPSISDLKNWSIKWWHSAYIN